MLNFIERLPEWHPVVRIKRRAGRARRHASRLWWERITGKRYRAWVDDSRKRVPGSVENEMCIAVIIPVFNPPVDFLRRCLQSVTNQTARNWQLIISDDGSSHSDVVAYLSEFEEESAHDPRITIVKGANAGISAACNRGLDHVTAEWFGWLDHDDELNPRALEIVSVYLSADPEIDIVYSDEDKITERGEHFELYCKPDYSPELLLTQMYLCHFTAFRTSTVREIGGFRSAMDGAQDFDLALRLSKTDPRVCHIPHPLYHWRAWTGSTALTIDAKPWAQEASARAQADFLADAFGGGLVTPSRVPGLNEVHPMLTCERTQSAPMPISVIIPTIGRRDSVGARFVDAAVESLRKGESLPLNIVAVTTGVIDPIPGVDAQVVYQPAGDFNFSEAINIGRAHATGEFLLLLNDDTTVAKPQPVTALLEMCQISGVGVTGALLTYPDGRIQHAGIVLLPTGPTHVFIGKSGTWSGYFGSTLTPRNFSAVTAAAMMVRTEVFDEVGGFDSVFARDFNDVDFCLRVGRAGYRVAWTPYSHFTHREGASIVRTRADSHEHALFTERWASSLGADPYYSRALSPSLTRIYEPL